MNGLAIRRATPSDLTVIVASNCALALETEGKTLDATTIERGVAALLADDSKGFYLLAERAGQFVAQLMLTYEWSDWRNGTFWWIQSVYVSPTARRTGAYRSLYDRVVDLAKEAGGVCGLRLCVDTANARAQATYTAMGMQRSHYDLYEVDFVFGSS